MTTAERALGPTPSSDRLSLRLLTADDAEALHRSAGDPAVMRYWAPGPDRDVAVTAARIADIGGHWKEHGFGDWAVIDRQDGEVIGFAGLHHIADMSEVNLGYVLESSRWRQGLGSELCRLLLAYGYSTLELPEIVAVIDPRNVASIALVEKHGLRLRRRFVWSGHARMLYAITRDEWQRSIEGEES